MAGQRQPIELVIAKGNKHLTKAEIEARRNGEIRPLSGDMEPPAYLTKKQKAHFNSQLNSNHQPRGQRNLLSHMRIKPMDDKDFITRFEVDERLKRVDDENNRQNHRIDKLEKIADQLTDMAASIKAMVVTMQSMQKEQERQGERLDDIERKPADNWDKLVYSIIAMVATAAVTYILTKGGL